MTVVGNSEFYRISLALKMVFVMNNIELRDALQREANFARSPCERRQEIEPTIRQLRRKWLCSRPRMWG